MRHTGLAVLAAMAALWGLAAATVMLFPEDPSAWILILAGPPFLAGIAMALAYGMRRGSRIVKTHGPRLNDVGLRRFLGPVFLFDNGLCVLMAGGGVFFFIFLDKHGAILRPSLAEVVRWTGPFRTRYVRRIRPAIGQTIAEAGLSDLKSRLGATVAVGSVRKVIADPSSPNPAAVVVIAHLIFLVGGSRPNRVIENLDLLTSHLQETYRSFAADGSAAALWR